MDKSDLSKEDLLKEAKADLDKSVELSYNHKFEDSLQLAMNVASIFERFSLWEEYLEAKNTICICKIFLEGNTDFMEVERSLIQTLQLTNNKLGAIHIQTYAATNRLGFWYAQFMENPFQAQKYFKKGLDILIELNEKEYEVNIVSDYSNLAYVHTLTNDFVSAAIYAEKAISTLRQIKMEDSLNVSLDFTVNLNNEIIFYTNLGAYYTELNDEVKALQNLNHALQLCHQNEFEGKNNKEAHIKKALSKIHKDQGDFFQAYVLAEQVLDHQLKYLPETHPDIALCYHELARYKMYLKDHKKAIDFLNKAEKIYSKFDTVSRADVSSNMLLGSVLYLELEDFEKSLAYVQKSFTVLFPNFQYSTLYENPTSTEHFDSVQLIRIYSQKIKCLLEFFLVENEYSHLLNVAQKTLEKGLEIIDKAKKSFRNQQSRLFLSSQSEIVQIFDLGVQIFALTNDWQKAYLFCEKAKANTLLTAIQDNISKTSANIPSLLLDKEINLKSQLTFLEKQIAKEEAKGKEQRENILLQWKSQFFDLHQEYLQLIQQFEQDYPDYYQLKYETQTVSIGVIQQGLAENQMMVNYFVGEKYLYIFFVSSDSFEVHQVEIADDFEKLVNDFLQSIHNHQFEKYAETAYELYQFLLQPLEMHLIDFFAEPSMTEQNKASKKLLIVPHGILNYVPFEALLCSPVEDFLRVEEKENSLNRYHDLDYLLLHCEVSYHYSATLWHYLLKQQQQVGERAAIENSFVGFAPVYEAEVGSKRQEVGGEKLEGESDTLLENLNEAAKAVGQWATRSEALRSDGTWNPLPHSKTEAQNIAALFGEKGLKSKTFLHEQATKEQFQKVVENSRFLLVAAHGVVNDEQPKLSGLVFYPEGKQEVGSKKQDITKDTSAPSSRFLLPTSNTDCILSMEETYHLNLSKTDLVVLSSCESGIGQLAKGEGMMAVNRGFLYAGAKNVVSTLFKVYDRPSSLLTQYLFEGVLGGLSYTSALRLAKLKLLKEKEVDVKSWCGFVLIGG